MLREFLYVDVTRVRSLLSQLDEGVVEEVVKQRSQRAQSELSAALRGLGGGRVSERTSSYEESRSLQDMVFVIFEEIAESGGLIRTLENDDLADASAWRESEVHDTLTEGEIVRIFLPMLLVDPPFVRGRVHRFFELNDALVQMGMGQLEAEISKLEDESKKELDKVVQDLESKGVDKNKIRTERRRLEKQLREEANSAKALIKAGSAQPLGADILAVGTVIERFVATDAITVRWLACGDENPDLSFSGSLLARDEYIQRERDALFSRFGSRLSGWTAVVQIAAVPTKAQRDAALARSFDDLAFMRDDRIDRAAVDHGIMSLLGQFEALGVAEGPIWPGISVTPLAIYRTVPRSDGIDSGESAPPIAVRTPEA